MSIETMMQRIWSTIATPEGMKPEVQLADNEWQLILAEWPGEYGNSGIIRKSRESVEKLREDWEAGRYFYLRGYKIQVTII